MQPEMETQPMESQPISEGGEGAAQVNVINRMASLPVVSSTLTQVTNAYNWTKDKNSLVKYTLEMAESTVSMAASTAQPVVNKLEKPISAANDYANKQMDKLEEKVPIITDTPEKIKADLQDGTLKMYENTKKASSDRINNLLLTRLGKVLTTSVDTALLLSEFAVDYYLPADEKSKNGELPIQQEALAAAGVEDQEPIPEDKPLEATVQRASRVSNKVRRRVVNKAMRNVRYAQKRSQETLERLHYTVDLIEYARTNIDSANKAVQGRIESTHQTLSKTWDDWTLEEGDQAKEGANSEVEATNGEQKTLAIARNLAGRLRVLSGNVAGCVRLLPSSLATKVEEGRQLADSLYNSLEEWLVKNMKRSITNGNAPSSENGVQPMTADATLENQTKTMVQFMVDCDTTRTAYIIEEDVTQEKTSDVLSTCSTAEAGDSPRENGVKEDDHLLDTPNGSPAKEGKSPSKKRRAKFLPKIQKKKANKE